MSYRKFKADLLFTGTRILPSTSVLITDEMGIVQDLVEEGQAGENIEFFKGMLIPGFVNTHCHLELSHMKGRIPEGTGLIKFLTRVIRERNVEPELIQLAMQAAETELHTNGTVAVGDICNTAASIAIKKNSRTNWRNFIEVLGFSQEMAPERFAHSERILQEFNSTGAKDDSTASVKTSPFISHASLSPHAPYSVSSDLFKLINEASSKKIISIHNQESEAENTLYQHGEGPVFELYKNLQIDPFFFKPTGKTSLQSFLPWLNMAASIILVHNSFISKDDMQYVQSQTSGPELFFCICINANRYIESKNPPIDLLRKYNCTITLGTDSYASNHQLSILEEIKTIQEQFGSSIPQTEILQWATLNGAKALGFQNKLGSFEKGKQPGVLLIDKVQSELIEKDASVKRII